MTQDYNKKSIRQFQCRDYLWEIFEQMGSELECSVDYLINEAMRQYARSRSQTRGGAASGSVSGGRLGGPTGRIPSMARSPSRPGPAPGPGSGAGSAPKPPPPSMPSAPPPLPSSGAAPPSASTSMPNLHVIFNGQKIPVQKEEFVIGRGSKTADLPIKDGNISRRHAAVVLQDGAFFMKDLGSTNGIEFNGERVAAKKIEEGDVFQLCDYELKFTYR